MRSQVPPESEHAYRQYCMEIGPILEERERSWCMLLEAGFLQKPRATLQRETRRGIAHAYRGKIWLETSGANAKRAASGTLYAQLSGQIHEVTSVSWISCVIVNLTFYHVVGGQRNTGADRKRSPTHHAR